MTTFQKAIDWLKKGKKVRRKAWHEEVYIFLNKWTENISYWDKAKFGFQLYDLEKTDWEIYEEKVCSHEYCMNKELRKVDIKTTEGDATLNLCDEHYRDLCHGSQGKYSITNFKKPKEETLSDKRYSRSSGPDGIRWGYKQENVKETFKQIEEDIKRVERVNQNSGYNQGYDNALRRVITIIKKRLGNELI